MRKRDLVLIAAGVLLAAVLLFTFRSAKREAPPPRTLAGRALPSLAALDLSRRYDVSAFLETDHPVFYRSVRIVGITAAPREEDPLLTGSDWLVFELTDKRRVYLRGASINVVEEVKGENQP